MTVVLFMAGDLMGGAFVAPGEGVRPAFSVITFGLFWLLLLAGSRMYDRWFLENRTGMIYRSLRAAVVAVAILAPICVLFDMLYLLKPIIVAVPVAAALTIAGRYTTLAVLRTVQREYVRQRALVIGPADSVVTLLTALQRDRSYGLRVAGACITDLDQARKITAQNIPVYGDLKDVAGTALGAGCTAVLVALPLEMDPYKMRRLAWELSDNDIELLVAPALPEVAPERVAVLPSGGGPLLHVRAPVLTGPQRAVKNVLDRLLATILLILAGPFMIFTAIMIRVTTPGPALFRQPRAGINGKEFTCYKFRTMVKDADKKRQEIEHLNQNADGLLFKMKRDPRVTKVGSILRRTSLDELPQLLNVINGTMSMVGPRPPLMSEVAGYDDDVRRRLLVKPGMTGLWQVSGRSDLSRQESVRLDLNYVDNWSPLLDLRILARTANAVIRGTGAY
ncbi:sugar transferase [Dactylosporangium matsuzakiense]|uniref:sugar transferase n=1 Tax=Dactylosporangium matsuzakiense TaxID=53360 RepID=UPI0021C394FC|nr:sugar transferase [Dactylosporangium matsuzakiense]UWZ46192.1 sugar transferase [Dactylosporangium matsuzakiense]